MNSESGPFLSCDTCRSRFHCSCVSVSSELISALSDVRGFFWRCENCFEKDVCAQRFGKLLTIMQNMKNSSNASNSLNLPDKYSNNIDDDAMEESVCATPANKRARSLTPNLGKYVMPVVKRTKINFNEPDPDVNLPLNIESAADPPSQSTSGNSNANHNVFDIDSCVVRQSERYFHLSQFNPATDADKIKSYIVSKLKCDPQEITCHKLVSSKRDSSKPLTFVSFKVGTTKKLAKKIVNKSIWPQGINIKAFEDHSKNEYVQPHLKRQRTQSQCRNLPLTQTHHVRPQQQQPSRPQQQHTRLLQQPARSQQQPAARQLNNRNRNSKRQQVFQSNRQLMWNESYHD